MNTRQQWILSWINARPADCTCCCSREFSLKSVHVGLSTASLYTPRLPGALTAPSYNTQRAQHRSTDIPLSRRSRGDGRCCRSVASSSRRRCGDGRRGCGRGRAARSTLRRRLLLLLLLLLELCESLSLREVHLSLTLRPWLIRLHIVSKRRQLELGASAKHLPCLLQCRQHPLREGALCNTGRQLRCDVIDAL